MSQSLDCKVIKKKKGLFKKACVIFSILIMLIILIKLYYNISISPISPNSTEEINIYIPKGSSTMGIAEILEKNNLIRNKYIFIIYTKIKNKESQLKAGEYILIKGMSVKEIVEDLAKGNALVKTKKFTIPEGYELKQIADKLSKEGIVNREKFLELASNISYFTTEFEFLKELPEGSTLEGYLFPDTYEIYNNASEEEIIKKMLSRFKEVYLEQIIKKSKDLNLTLNQVVTLASIIEREGKIDEERPIISAVFHNRLKKGMLLQSCATVQYALGERKERLTYEDLKVESKYNTYLHEGLPPGPIASPGTESIKAAVNPAPVDYLYFVSNGDGTHTFSTNLKDHINAKNKN